MATGVEELLDMLFEMIDTAKGAAFGGGKCVIERDRALDLIEEIKDKFPVELAEANKILNARNEYVARAKREADEVRKAAEAEARKLVDEARVTSQAKEKASALLKEAQEKADAIVAEAKGKADALVDQSQKKAKEVRRSANEYCVDLLRRTEEALIEAHGEVHRVHANFSSAMNKPAASSGNSRVYDAEAEMN